MFMLFRDIKRRIFSIFKSSNANQLKIDAGQKNGDGTLRHLNVRIAKNNLAYPLVRDTFSVLDN